MDKCVCKTPCGKIAGLLTENGVATYRGFGMPRLGAGNIPRSSTTGTVYIRPPNSGMPAFRTERTVPNRTPVAHFTITNSEKISLSLIAKTA